MRFIASSAAVGCRPRTTAIGLVVKGQRMVTRRVNKTLFPENLAPLPRLRRTLRAPFFDGLRHRVCVFSHEVAWSRFVGSQVDFLPCESIEGFHGTSKMQTPEGITVIPISFQDVGALLKSDELSAVEKEIASRCRLNIIYDRGSAGTSYTQAEISVCGMTVDQLTGYLADNKNSLIDFGVRFMSDEDATNDEQEYPEGEEQDPDGESEALGYGNGFGIKVAIYHNFLANRTAAEFRAFLKNQRIPKHTKFAKELARTFAGSNPTSE